MFIHSPVVDDGLAPIYRQATVGLGDEAIVISNGYLRAVAHFTSSISSQTPAQRFAIFSATWKEDLRFSSSVRELMSNPAYLGIIAMGEVALPFIFEDLKRQNDYWYTALKIITRIDPVPAMSRGDLVKMRAAWLAWGIQQRYVA